VAIILGAVLLWGVLVVVAVDGVVSSREVGGSKSARKQIIFLFHVMAIHKIRCRAYNIVSERDAFNFIDWCTRHNVDG